MQKTHFIIIISMLALSMLGCKQSDVQQITYAHGRPGDVIVVMSNERWNSELGDSLRALFGVEVPGLPLEEPVLDLHQIQRDKFIEANRQHKNIIYTEINPEIEKSTVTVTNNKYAVNQTFIHIKAKNQFDFIQLLNEYGNKLINIFVETDRERWLSQLSKYKNETLSEKITKQYEINLSIPKNYYGDVLHENFAWISNETKKYTMSILIYTYPLVDDTELDLEYLISKRNVVLEANVPGARKGSYMTTETKYDFPVINKMIHNGVTTAVIRGLWKVKGDFMGGPFISFTKIDEARGRVVTVEGFVYHPNQETRDQIRQLEGVLYTFDFVK
ncbi:DUF4837 family protein [Bacteroidales bacterium OttesenSCG-928-I21]|nr:DUF4837 family protein [Bacteroidales bacterium OttesenSCG-928-I21]